MENTVTSSNLYLANRKRMNEWMNNWMNEWNMKAKYKCIVHIFRFIQTTNIDDT